MKMKAYLNKCGDCNKKFLSTKGGFQRMAIIRKVLKSIPHHIFGRANITIPEKEVVEADIPQYEIFDDRCPRCSSTKIKTIAILDIQDNRIIDRLKEHGYCYRW